MPEKTKRVLKLIREFATGCMNIHNPFTEFGIFLAPFPSSSQRKVQLYTSLPYKDPIRTHPCTPKVYQLYAGLFFISRNHAILII